MVSLKSIGGIVLGAYVLLNSNVALSKDITEVTHDIKQCYDNEPFGLTKNTKEKKKDRCAKAVIEDFADKEGNKDGFATPDEIKTVLSKLGSILKEDLKEKVKRLYPAYFKNKTEEKDKEINPDVSPLPPATSDVKITVEYISRSEPGYAKLIIKLGNERFEFLDSENDELFNRDDDCISKDDLKVCGKNLENVVALVDGEKTTHEDYFKEAKKKIVKAFADYLLNAIDDGASYYPRGKEGYERIDFSDNKYHFIVMDYGSDGITDTFYVQEKGKEYILKINKDDSEGMKKIIGGLLHTAKSKSKKQAL